ncbi:MAG: YidC/Oxa1 family insertase periplasmic-domain containing protein [Phycisphaerae bacterium]|nr:YidC/Oxa1 family insertase periplasmic-domain containing protein [Phycisphaerae bacterium]
MPQEPNRLLRVVIPVVLGLAGLFIAIAVMKNTGKQHAPPITANTPATPGKQPDAAGPAADPSAPTPQTPPEPEQGTPDKGTPDKGAPEKGAGDQPSTPGGGNAAPIAGLHAQVFENDPLAANFAAVGSLDAPGKNPSAPHLKIEFDDQGAGVRELRLADHYESVRDQTNVVVQKAVEHNGVRLVPFAAQWLRVNGENVYLIRNPAGPVWRQRGADMPGRFEAIILDGASAPVARVERDYIIRPNSHVIELAQRVVNLSPGAISVSLVANGPADLPQEAGGYGGDKRKVRFGYLLNANQDPSRRHPVSNEFITPHQTALGKAENGLYEPVEPQWPNELSREHGYELTWAGMTNRYFTVAVMPWFEGDKPAVMSLSGYSMVDRVLLGSAASVSDAATGRLRAKVARVNPSNQTEPEMALRLASVEALVAPGGTRDFSMAIYAGPLSKPQISREPVADASKMQGLVVFNFGGMCGPCTFPVVTEGLHALLLFFHDYLTKDWALAIALLVVCVRTVLHPLTRWSQIKMQRFAKQMQSMGPKQKVIQERYGADRQKLQQEMAKLWREEGVSPLGMVGCLPMFLVTPIWIALYAMLYFSVELRHEPAFYGVVQKVIPNFPNFMGWFLSDLSEPDRFIRFNSSVTIPMIGEVDSINILPLILGVVFFVHQKYLTPPSATQLTPEQEMQQKMVKWMSVIMFPVFMYGAPAGLAVYFIVNSTLAIFENKWIRAHAEKHGLLEVDKTKKTKKKEGFFAKLQRAAEERAKAVEQARKQAQKKR